MRITLAGLLVALLAVAGCNRESPKATTGPTGAKATTTQTSETKIDNKGTTTVQTTETVKTDKGSRREGFSILVPKGPNVTQGKREEVSISVNRDGDFKQGVKLAFKVPAGLKIVPENDVMIKADQGKTNVFIEAEDNATTGRHTVTVTGTAADSDATTSVEMPVDVKKK